ncbi:hypothetical protein KCG44_03980 [Pacificimonas sp. WHA3]|uniref:PEP-CTERM protein-sorting domain-containing protein n=1 Tax=Pacificimonas pallii TaxID=2827236 RepID=A0ABS6SBZ5_9SPHN|nr:hypothetical protein [Pacificimonas pallii]MBV7255939.1 hypothetical protein [Pacificimonas pallii]
MKTILSFLTGCAAIAVASPAAAVIIDGALGYSFPYLRATHLSPNVSESIQHASILGGERDISIEVVTVDGPFIDVRAGGGPNRFGVNQHSWSLDQGGIANVTLQYDGLDNSAARGTGWSLNLAALGDNLFVPAATQFLLPFGEDGPVPWPLTLTLIDGNGHKASIMHDIGVATRFNPYTELNYSLADFLTMTPELNLSDIDVIEVSAEINSRSPATQWIYFGALEINGDPFPFVPGGPGDPGDPDPDPQAVPAPPALALLGLGLAIMAVRSGRRRQA